MMSIAILDDAWDPYLRLHHVLTVIQTLLAEPNPSEPLDADIADQFVNRRDEFEATAREWTASHAM